MALDYNLNAGQTPISPEEGEGLLMAEVTTLGQLNDAEAVNIESAQFEFALVTAPSDEIIDEPFIRTVHFRMFHRVWAWAGHFRRTDKNMGAPWPEIPLAYRQLRDDTRFWIENATYPPDELAIRYKHRLVSIHPFPNGNGRHSRLLADLLVESLGPDRFSWGIGSEEPRREYLLALKAADRGEIAPLVAFARR